MAGNIEERLMRVISALRQLLPDEDIRSVEELTRSREWGIALENLCDQLYEFGASVPSSILAEIGSLGAEMGLDEAYWQDPGG